MVSSFFQVETEWKYMAYLEVDELAAYFPFALAFPLFLPLIPANWLLIWYELADAHMDLKAKHLKYSIVSEIQHLC